MVNEELTPTQQAAYPTTAPEKNEESSAFEAGARMQLNPIGSSGTQVYGGYFAEEYLHNLRGSRGAKVWEEMLRSEPQIAMLNAAVTNSIKSANWTFEAAKDVENAQLHADLVTAVFKDMIDFDTMLHEVLTFFRSGFSLFEVIHNVNFNHPKFGTFNGIKAMAFRGQKTIERWNLEKVTGKLLSVDQYVYSDIGTNATIPGDFLTVFTLHKEGDNYEGVSALRAMYGPWIRKNLYLKLAAIGVEKSAVGTVVGKTPKGKLDEKELNNFKKVLSSFTSHEASYMMVPEGWEVDVKFSDFDPSKLKELIVQENTEMANAAVASFLMLGMNGGGGSFALGTDLSDFFLSGIQNYANLVCGVFNRKTIPDLIKLNYGEQAAYPQMKCTGINDKAGKELADIIKQFVDSKVWKADDKLEEFTRKQYGVPAADPTTARESAAPAPFKFTETRIQLDEKYVKQFDKSAEDLKALMQESLTTSYELMKADIRRKWKSTSESERIKIGSKLEAKAIPAYKLSLREELAKIANIALDGARKETRSTVKLCEAIKLAAPSGGYYAALPPRVKKLVDAQTALIADSQAADLEKIVTFGYTSGAAAYDNIDTILNDIDGDAEAFLEGGIKSGASINAAAGNAVANVSNQARMEFFFDPEVLETIESFTFTNEDPVSEICTALDGTTVPTGSPELDTYATPLHHNCKSRWVPNLKNDKDNPEVERGPLSISQKALNSITLCDHSHRA